MHSLIETQRNALLALANRRGVTAVRVFGSMSRGDAGDASDVDLLVTLAPGTSALALGNLLLDVQELLGCRVDVVTEASLHPAARAGGGQRFAVVKPRSNLIWIAGIGAVVFFALLASGTKPTGTSV